MTWTQLASHTTNRNTSRFVLESKITYGGDYVNLQPALRSTGEAGRGGAFYITTADPIQLNSNGES